MKTILNSVIVCLLTFELISPFLIGYLNASTKTTYAIKTEKNKQASKPKAKKQASKIGDLVLFDESFSDSKTLKLRETLKQGK